MPGSVIIALKSMDILNVIVSAVAGGLAGLISGVLKEPLVEKYRQHQNKKSLFSEMGINYCRLNTTRETLEHIVAEMNLSREIATDIGKSGTTRSCYDFLTKDVVMFSRMPQRELIRRYYEEIEKADDPNIPIGRRVYYFKKACEYLEDFAGLLSRSDRGVLLGYIGSDYKRMR